MSTRPQPQQLGIQGLGLDSGSWSWAQALPPEEVCHQEPALRGEMAEGMPPMQVGAAPAQRHGRAAWPWGRGCGAAGTAGPERAGAEAEARDESRHGRAGSPSRRAPWALKQARPRSPVPWPAGPARAAQPQAPEAACRPGPVPVPSGGPAGASGPERVVLGTPRSPSRVSTPAWGLTAAGKEACWQYSGRPRRFTPQPL